MPHTLDMTDITMQFPGVKALDGVRFSTRSGIVHALVGANGAGKSTLMKILSGACDRYGGTISIDGAPVSIRSPLDAKRAGIEIVHQEIDIGLVPYFDVGENIMLDAIAARGSGSFFYRRREVYSRAAETLSRLGALIDVKKKISDCSIAEKQLTLIARSLSRDCRFLVLDEPTAPLGSRETKKLFAAVRELVRQDVGVVFISHRLDEVLSLCESVTVLRDGRVAATVNADETDINGIVELMLGQKLGKPERKAASKIGAPLLDVRGLRDGEKLSGIDLTVRAGEVLGVTGPVGAGKTELCKALFGARGAKWESASLGGKSYRPRSPAEAVRAGVALVPEERRREGIHVDESVAFNLMTAGPGVAGKFGFIDFARERKKAREMIDALGIRTTGSGKKVRFLSGGNQQKVSIGKWLVNDADVYIFDEPTKGVDIQAKQELFSLILGLAERGKGVIYASGELPEILQICSRVIVLYDGAAIFESSSSDTCEEDLMYYSAGGGI